MRGGAKASILALVIFVAATPPVTTVADPLRPLTNPVGSILDEAEQRASNVINRSGDRIDESVDRAARHLLALVAEMRRALAEVIAKPIDQTNQTIQQAILDLINKADEFQTILENFENCGPQIMESLISSIDSSTNQLRADLTGAISGSDPWVMSVRHLSGPHAGQDLNTTVGIWTDTWSGYFRVIGVNLSDQRCSAPEVVLRNLDGGAIVPAEIVGQPNPRVLDLRFRERPRPGNYQLAVTSHAPRLLGFWCRPQPTTTMALQVREPPSYQINVEVQGTCRDGETRTFSMSRNVYGSCTTRDTRTQDLRPSVGWEEFGPADDEWIINSVENSVRSHDGECGAAFGDSGVADGIRRGDNNTVQVRMACNQLGQNDCHHESKHRLDNTAAVNMTRRVPPARLTANATMRLQGYSQVSEPLSVQLCNATETVALSGHVSVDGGLAVPFIARTQPRRLSFGISHPSGVRMHWDSGSSRLVVTTPGRSCPVRR